MIINEGYWNYYMAFQVKSRADVLRSIQEDRYNDFVVASFMDNQVFVNINYGNNEDINIQSYIGKYMTVLQNTGEAVSIVHGKELNQKTTISLMSPMVMKFINGSEILCPIFMYLVNTGLGILKIRVPLDEMNAEVLKTLPLEKWYKSVSLVHINDNRIDYEVCDEKNNYVDDIVSLLRKMINTTFSGHLVSEHKNLCFENFVLYNTSNPNILSKSFKSEELRELYHVCFPENYLEFPSNSKVNDFWNTSHCDIGGIDFVSGVPGRMLIFSDVDKLLNFHKRKEINDKLEYFENSLQFSFDWPICIALWKKINEINFFDSSENNYHKINYNNAVYNLRENELDSMLDLCPLNCKKVYQFIYNILTQSLNSFNNRVERLLMLENYAKERFNEKRTLIFESIAFLGTAIFGLPAIFETVGLVRITIFPFTGDMVKGITINEISLGIWGVIIVIFGYRLFRNYQQYKSYRL